MRQERLFKVMRVEPVKGSETILKVADNDAPLLIERRQGRGSVMLMATSADLQWTSLPKADLYTILIHQAVTHMSSRPESLRYLVGEDATLSINGHKAGETVRISGPMGDPVNVQLAAQENRVVCPIPTSRPGIYVAETSGDKTVEARTVAINVDAGESNVRVIDSTVLEERVSDTAVEVVSANESMLSAITQGRVGLELTKTLLILGLLVFIAQGFLARLFTNRIDRSEVDVTSALQKSRVAAARRS